MKLDQGSSKRFYVAGGAELRMAFSQLIVEEIFRFIVPDTIRRPDPIGWRVLCGAPFTVSATQDIDPRSPEVGVDHLGQEHFVRLAQFPHWKEGRFNIRFDTGKGSKRLHPIPHDMPSEEDVAKWELVTRTITQSGRAYIELRFLNVANVVVPVVGAARTLGDF